MTVVCLERVFGSNVALGIDSAIAIPTHGYCGLSHCLQLRFQWTYGLGHSLAAQELLRRFTGIDVYERTYLARSEMRSGWYGLQWWSTVFPWLASDVTFPGALLVMVMAGFLFAKTWMEAAYECNPVALALFAQLTLAVLFVPANSQIFQESQTMFGTYGLLLWYLFCQNRRTLASRHPIRAPAFGQFITG